MKDALSQSPERTLQSGLQSGPQSVPPAGHDPAGYEIDGLEFRMTPQMFRAEYFERAPRLFRGALHDRPFAWTDLDRLLQEHEPTPKELQLFNRGRIDDQTYTEVCSDFGVHRKRLNKVRFYGHLNAGATLVLNRLEMRSAEAQRLTAAVGRFAGLPATSNAYVSFRGDGTFGKHWDTHDVFAIQLLGRKRWRLFAPTWPLPLSQQTSERSGQACPASATLDCVLEAGDVLYLPRGWWHHVIPFEEGSMHLSVGTYAATIHDYLLWVCSRVLPQDVRSRPAIDSGAPSAYTALLESAGAAARDPQLLREFHEQIMQRERTTAEFNLELFARATMPPLDESTQVRLNSCYEPVAGAPLMVNGASLQLDDLSARIVTLLSGASALTLAQLQLRLPSVAATAIRAAVLNLNRYEVASLNVPQISVGR